MWCRNMRPHHIVLTQSPQGIVVLHHLVPVKLSLVGAQVLGLFQSEVQSNVLEGHHVL